MTAFVVSSETSFQRMGVTASKKAIGNSVKRNRAKRLMREAFRLSSGEFVVLNNRYDWVFNARAYILGVRTQEVAREIVTMIAKIREFELNSAKLREAESADPGSISETRLSSES